MGHETDIWPIFQICSKYNKVDMMGIDSATWQILRDAVHRLNGKRNDWTMKIHE